MSALQDALSKAVAELGKATAASADAVGVDSLAELKRLTGAVNAAVKESKASIETAAQQNKTSMETRTKAEAANMAALKASIDTLNANVVQAEKMTKIRWAYDHATIGQHYTNSTTVQTILLAFMMEKGKYTDEITTNEEHLKKTIDQLENMLGKRPVIRPANGKNALFYD